jgi:hypothetical protein
MTPEKAEAVLRATLASLGAFIEEVKAINEAHPGLAAHLLATMLQAHASLKIMIERDPINDVD